MLALLIFAGSVHAVSEIGSRKLIPNEAGRIMILMYHGIGHSEDTWIRSRSNFEQDLRTLYEKGYRPISLKDMVNNHITTEAGYSPVVLTFDDGRTDNFRILERNGEHVVDPLSAVGILERFHKDHPDFPLEATFFLYGRYPFGQETWLQYKLNYLVANGMDIGNHTLTHTNLKYDDKPQSPARIQRLIGAQAKFLEEQLTEHPTYRVDSYALCNGRRPRDTALRKYLFSGTYRGHRYKNIAITRVGGGPSPSPVSRNFNRFSIPRIRASNHQTGSRGLTAWFHYFDNHPEQRYVSDGNPHTVTVPEPLRGNVDPHRLGGASLVLSERKPL